MVLPYPLPSQYHQNGHAQSQQYRALGQPMDRQSSEYSQSPISAPTSYSQYPTAHLDTQNGEQSTPQPQQAAPQDTRSTYSSSATPTSETGPVYTRNPTFGADQIITSRYVDGSHRYQPSSTSSGGMAQNVSTSSSPGIKADPERPEDSSVAAPSPTTFAPGHYGSQHPPGPYAMPEGYAPHPGAPGWRNDAWSGYAPQHMAHSPYQTPSPASMAASPAGMNSSARPVSAKPGQRKRAGEGGAPGPHLSQVYSFVPIPGAQQNKRPRRRYEEIERMYKCGWNGCEKAYGTLNHLNAHVTMQGHGTKRTPEEFKEIRKEWKARKKEEEAQRKAAEEEARRRAQEEAGTSGAEGQPAASNPQYVAGMPPQRQLPPPSAYQPGVSIGNGVHYSTATAAPTAPMDNMQQYQQSPIYGSYGTHPQYAGQPQQIFSAQQRPATSQSNGNNNTNSGGEDPDADAEPDPDLTAPASSYNS